MSAAALRSSSPDADSSSPPARRYGAFLSYSHRDAVLATWLQRGLETYRLPPRLAGRETAVGPVPRSVGPVFRDRDELPAGADLATHVREGLAASRWLIVVCSPAAAASPWVEREILEFKRLHGEERVLAVIASGEPYASRVAGREAEECFPRALRHARAADGTPSGAELEPIAVDLRKQGDGKRMALLKLIAGMTGVGVDELAQRDAQRRARRLAWLAVGATVGMLVMAVMAVMALQARNEAREQRAQAEDLIEFMLGDLRKKLEPVGRLEVLDAVGEKALGYYDRQDATTLDATSLGHRSRAMHLIGEIRELRGQRDQALEAFRSAAETTARLLARTPNDPQRVFDHAQSVFWVGNTAWRRGDLSTALQYLGQYLELAKRLVALDPTKPEWQIELAMASTNVGVVLNRQGQRREALTLFEEVQRLYVPLVETHPELRYDLSQVHGWIAEAREAIGDYERAEAAQRAKLPLLDGMPDAAKNRTVQATRSNAIYMLARYALATGRPAEAERAAREAVDIGRAIVEFDESNQNWRATLSVAQLELANALAAQGRCVEARAEAKEVPGVIAHLLAVDPQSIDALVIRGKWLVFAARCAARPAPELVEEMDGFVTAARALLSQPGSRSVDRVRLVSTVELGLGRLLAALGKRDAARAHWRSALAELDSADPRQESPATQAVLAQLHLELGEADAARALVVKLRASSLRSPQVLELLSDPSLEPAVSPQATGRIRK